jgi:MFS family permease
VSRRRASILLAIGLVFGMTTWFSASAVLPALRALWSLSSGESAWLTIAVQIGFVAGSLLSAGTNLADRMPVRTLILVSAIGAAAANALVIVAPDVWTAIALRLVTGAFVAGIYPPALKLIATYFRSGRGVAIGVMVGALTIGSAMPHLVNGLGGLDWRVVVAASSVMTVLGGAAAGMVTDGPYPFPRGTFEPRFAMRLFTDPALRLAGFGYFGHMWELYAMWAWFVVFFGDSLVASGTPDARMLASLGTFAVVGAGAVGCYAGGILGDRWGRTNTTALAMAVSGTCALLIGATFGRSPLLVLGIGLIWGIAVVADSAQFSTIVTELSDQSYVGTAVTTQLAVGFSLTVATIWLIPLVRDAVGWQWAFAILAPGPALGVLAMLRLRARPEARRIAGGLG